MRTLVGFSGGVDSSCVLQHFLDQGDEVIAATLIMHHDPQSPSPESLDLAKQTCEQLNIKHVVYDVSQRFNEIVVQRFFDEYMQGITPSPCIICDREIKFKSLVELAHTYHCDRISTGHFVHKKKCFDGKYRLVEGGESSRDQAYFLCKLDPETIALCDFPLADNNKNEVRSYAHQHKLPAADAPSSNGVCFVPDGDYKAYAQKRYPQSFHAGDIVDTEGNVLGKHTGILNYTVGQRKGLGLSGGPWFVQALDAKTNRVVVSHEVYPRVQRFFVNEVALSVSIAYANEHNVCVQTHFRAQKIHARLSSCAQGCMCVELIDDQALISPGQMAAFYLEDTVIGGATIIGEELYNAYK